MTPEITNGNKSYTRRVSLSERSEEEQQYFRWLVEACLNSDHPEHEIAEATLIEDLLSGLNKSPQQTNWNVESIAPGKQRHTTSWQAESWNQQKDR